MTDSPDSPSGPRPLLRALFTGAPAADPFAGLNLAVTRARTRGFVVLPLGLQAATEARELASLHAAIALQSVRHGRPLAPTLILSAGAVLSNGAVAGAADFLLALALSLDENPAIFATACGPLPLAAASRSTGPIEEPADEPGAKGTARKTAELAAKHAAELAAEHAAENAAEQNPEHTANHPGVLLAPDTVRRAAALGLQPGALLMAGEARSLFAALGDTYAMVPAPEHVLRAILITQD